MWFDNILVVDWSGGNDRGPKPKKDAIWTALIDNGKAEVPRYHRNRQHVETYLHDLCKGIIGKGQSLLAGFDFPFGYPAPFAQTITGSPDPLALWDHYAAELIDTPMRNSRFIIANALNQRFGGIGPFWFNGSREDLPDLPRKGNERSNRDFPEKRLCEARAKGAFTCWQLGGAGAVGSQAITGMASLSRLRAGLPEHIAVWPFELLTKPIALVEVWPSLHAVQIRDETRQGEVKDAAQTRITAAKIHAAQANGTLSHLLDSPPAIARQSEGWILGLT